MLTDIATALAAEGMDISVVTSKHRYQDARARLLPLEHHRGVRIRRIPTTRLGRGNLVLRAIDYLSFYISVTATLLLGQKPDVLIAKTDPPMVGLIAALAARLRGIRYVSWCQDVFPEVVWAGRRDKDRSIPRHLLASLRNWSLRNASDVIALGEDMATYLENLPGLQGKVRNGPNWADGRAVTPIAPQDNPLRTEWGLQDHFVIGYSGNLGRVHEYNTLTAAAKRLPADTNIRFLIAGGGAKREQLERELPDELRRLFIFKPYVERDKLSLSLSVPDIHWVSLLPDYRHYVFPSKLYGILAAGRAVIFIGDTQSELAQLIARENFGMNIDHGDDSELADAITTLAAHPERAQAMGEAARKLFQDKYDFPHALHRWKSWLGNHPQTLWKPPETADPPDETPNVAPPTT